MKLAEKLSLLNNKALPFYKEEVLYTVRNIYLKRKRIRQYCFISQRY